jgi:hypothetical protein
MPYDFVVYSYDKFHHESLPTRTSVTVFDDEYLQSLWNRSIIQAIHNFGRVNINWSESVPNEVKSEIIYVNRQGQETVKEVPPTENFTIITDFEDWMEGFQFRTYILPEPTALDLYVTETKKYTQLTNDPARPGKMWDACESLDGWGGMGVALDGNDPREGSYCVRASGQGVVIFQKVFAPFDTEVSKENGYIAFSFYVDDVSALSDDGQFEITSSGREDSQEIHWSAPQLKANLVNGWNEVELKFSVADQYDSNVDIHAINFLRLYNFMTKSAVIKIDRLRFYEIP